MQTIVHSVHTTQVLCTLWDSGVFLCYYTGPKLEGGFENFCFFAGLGPPLDSEVFHTAPPGRPGSSSHVTVTWLLDDQAALVCWEPSEVGKPFLSYTIEVLEVKTNVTKIWKIAAEIVKENLPNCTAGYTVSV